MSPKLPTKLPTKFPPSPSHTLFPTPTPTHSFTSRLSPASNSQFQVSTPPHNLLIFRPLTPPFKAWAIDFHSGFLAGLLCHQPTCADTAFAIHQSAPHADVASTSRGNPMQVWVQPPTATSPVSQRDSHFLTIRPASAPASASTTLTPIGPITDDTQTTG